MAKSVVDVILSSTVLTSPPICQFDILPIDGWYRWDTFHPSSNCKRLLLHEKRPAPRNLHARSLRERQSAGFLDCDRNLLHQELDTRDSRDLRGEGLDSQELRMFDRLRFARTESTHSTSSMIERLRGR